MFEQNLLQGGHGHQARCAAIGLTGELGVLVLAILLAANSKVVPVRLSEVFVPLVLSAPPPSAAATTPAPARTAVNRAPATRFVPKTFIAPVLAAPQTIPQHAIVIADAEPLQDAPGTGVFGGVPGGVPGGSLNGLLGVLPLPPAPVTPPKPSTPPPVPTAPTQIRVGGEVEAARLTHEVLPAYPKLAKSARIEGMVRFSATIAADGTVKDLTVLGGQALLIGAAEDAVRQWIYRPTYLNGRPVEIVTEINVNFRLLDADRRH